MTLVLSSLAFLSPTFALFGAIFLYRLHCLARPKHRIPVIVYVAITLIAAGIAYLFGMIYGNDLLCSSPSAGNLCALAGIFVIGPLAAACAIVFVGLLILLLPRDEVSGAGRRP